jgi:hypothetical protein
MGDFGFLEFIAIGHKPKFGIKGKGLNLGMQINRAAITLGQGH